MVMDSHWSSSPEKPTTADSFPFHFLIALRLDGSHQTNCSQVHWWQGSSSPAGHQGLTQTPLLLWWWREKTSPLPPWHCRSPRDPQVSEERCTPHPQAALPTRGTFPLSHSSHSTLRSERLLKRLPWSCAYHTAFASSQPPSFVFRRQLNPTWLASLKMSTSVLSTLIASQSWYALDLH